jgi:hypothetical protein
MKRYLTGDFWFDYRQLVNSSLSINTMTKKIARIVSVRVLAVIARRRLISMNFFVCAAPVDDDRLVLALVE